MKKVQEFPSFEISGHPCKKENCKGTYCMTMDLNTKRWYQQCYSCKNIYSKELKVK